MKKLIILVVFTFLLSSFCFAQEEQIVWEKDFKKAQVLARETGRPLLLDFTASWCKPCQAMEKEFWVLNDVVKAMKPFVAVKIDFDKDKSTVGKYRVSAIPFVVFADPLGNMVTYRRGFGQKNVRELNEIFTLMPTDFSSLKGDYEAIETNKEDGKALLRIADFYRSKNMLFLSTDFYRRAAKSDVIKSDAEQLERIISFYGGNAYGSNDYKTAVKEIEDYLKDYPKGKFRETLLSMSAISSARLLKIKDAEKTLAQLKTEFPNSKNLAFIEKEIEKARNAKDSKN